MYLLLLQNLEKTQFSINKENSDLKSQIKAINEQLENLKMENKQYVDKNLELLKDEEQHDVAVQTVCSS